MIFSLTTGGQEWVVALDSPLLSVLPPLFFKHWETYHITLTQQLLDADFPYDPMTSCSCIYLIRDKTFCLILGLSVSPKGLSLPFWQPEGF